MDRGIVMFTVKKPWDFSIDPNNDGTFTISDFGHWFSQLYFLPGDCFLYFILNTFPALARFLEITQYDYHGWLSGILSFIIWVVLVCNIFAISNEISDAKNSKDDK